MQNDKKYTLKQLQSAVDSVNRRYKAGLNDDDQVAKMFLIAKNLKGYYIKPNYDTYEVCTDYDRLLSLCSQFGYWSNEVKDFNTTLIKKGGNDYKNSLNEKYIETTKKFDKTRIQPQLF